MTNFDFIRRKAIWFAFSAAVITVGLASLCIKGLAFGIEFKGGTMFEVKFGRSVAVDQVRAAVRPLGLGDSVIQKAGGKLGMLVRTRELGVDKQQEVKDAL